MRTTCIHSRRFAFAARVGVGCARGERAEVSDEQLEDAQRVARREAAPFVLLAVVADLALAVVSAWHDWQLYSADDWWIWLVLALPALLLASSSRSASAASG